MVGEAKGIRVGILVAASRDLLVNAIPMNREQGLCAVDVNKSRLAWAHRRKKR
jgi:hypothetical protein